MTLKNRFQSHITLGGHFSITFDTWTAPNQHALLGITCHWIDDSFKLQSAIIGKLFYLFYLL